MNPFEKFFGSGGKDRVQEFNATKRRIREGGLDSAHIQELREHIEKLKGRDEDEARRLNTQYDLLLKKHHETFNAMEQYEREHSEKNERELEEDVRYIALGKEFDETYAAVEDFEAQLNEELSET